MVVGRDAGRVVLIWPLVTHGGRGLRVARALDSETTEYREIVVEDARGSNGWVIQAWDYVTRDCGIDALYLQYVPDGAALAHAARQGASIISDQEEYRFLDYRAFSDWSDYCQTLSKNLRSNLRRRRRRLDEKGTVRIVVMNNPEDLGEFISWLFERKLSMLKTATGSTAWFAAPEHRSFMTGIALDGLKSGLSVATALTVDGRFIAGNLDFIYKKRSN